jgi:hypothetical protein
MGIVEEDESDEKKPGKTNKCLMGFVQWNDDRKSKHPMKTLRTKCLQARQQEVICNRRQRLNTR